MSPPATAVTLDEVLRAARQSRLEGHSTEPRSALAIMHRTSRALEQHDLWEALRPSLSDPDEHKLVSWYVETRRSGSLFFTQGPEHRLLDKIWRRVITDAVPPISADEQREHNSTQLMRLNTGRF